MVAVNKAQLVLKLIVTVVTALIGFLSEIKE